MIFFALIILVLMLFAGGMAVDLMRYEAERARIQATADAAALAAASMRQARAPCDVVDDWFDKADASDALLRCVADDTSLNYRRVRAETRTTTRPYFMHMMGVDELTSESAGTAEERRTNVEIAMVLDISGSMEGTRMTRLKSAAREFVDKILEDDTENRVSISLVPYSGQVNAGPDLITRYNVTDRHSQSYCVDLPHSSYSSIGLSRTAPMPQNAHADTYNGSGTNGYSTSSMAPDSANRWCINNSNNQIRVLSNNRSSLATQIQNLQAVGATSIDAGLRWGSALLDPGTRPVISSLADAGIVNGHFRGRPYDYDDPEALKVIVLMTDGEHWPNEFVKEGFRSGSSVIYRNSSNSQYSIYHAGRSGSNKYYYPHNNSWNNRPWGATSTTNMGTARQLTWQEVWQQLRVSWVAYQLYARPLGISQASAMDTLRTREGTVLNPAPHEVSRMDNRMLNLCGLLKGQNVAIFGIAFEAPVNGANLIRNCASPGRFYDVAGLDLNVAFRNIRAQISALRLTQ